MNLDSPLRLDQLLTHLRYPSANLHGMAVWGPHAPSHRAHAWVKWDGKTVTAEFASQSDSSPEPTLATLRLEMGDSGLVELGSQDRMALERFDCVPRTETPSFITLPRPPRTRLKV